jgi:hypothetical protein
LKRSQEKLDDILQWIKANLAKSITWEDLSKISQLDHRELIELFKSIHTTPMTYIRDQKRSLSSFNSIEHSLPHIKTHFSNQYLIDTQLSQEDLYIRRKNIITKKLSNAVPNVDIKINNDEIAFNKKYHFIEFSKLNNISRAKITNDEFYNVNEIFDIKTFLSLVVKMRKLS